MLWMDEFLHRWFVSVFIGFHKCLTDTAKIGYFLMRQASVFG